MAALSTGAAIVNILSTAAFTVAFTTAKGRTAHVTSK
jgi:hypothetical protein